MAVQKRIKLSDLTEETIRTATKAGDTPLHRAAKNGQFAEVPKHLLKVELFKVQNRALETPLHYAAKHGTLDQVPREFLTRETMTVPDYCGRTPLHVAASYRHFHQIPKEFITGEFLSLRNSGFTKNTILHLLAEINSLEVVPQELLTPDLMSIENGYGATPMEVLKAHVPTEGQKLRLDAIGYFGDRSKLTKEQAAVIINEHEQKYQVYAPKIPKQPSPSGPAELTYIKRSHSPERNSEEQSWKVVLLAKSSSRPAPYKVEFVVQGSNLLAWCHCPGGSKSLCKHLLAMLNDEEKVLFDKGQIPEFGYLRNLPQFQGLKERVETFQSEVNVLGEEIERKEQEFYDWYHAHCESVSPSEGTVLGEGAMIRIEFVRSTIDLMDAPYVQEKLKSMREETGILKEQRKHLREEFMRCLRVGFD